ncbi:hypothetical protein DXT76_20580 [Halobacillus trueperi]|uniref:Uncharacterized protein n=1 Tax=Halobacillus trueperi TaxID=156205 RepID=A0A3D8VBP9_9BACI|nr:hypothetical protein DXT76_20580 [Halobacillus trueperi]
MNNFQYTRFNSIPFFLQNNGLPYIYVKTALRMTKFWRRNGNGLLHLIHFLYHPCLFSKSFGNTKERGDTCEMEE